MAGHSNLTVYLVDPHEPVDDCTERCTRRPRTVYGTIASLDYVTTTPNPVARSQGDGGRGILRFEGERVFFSLGLRTFAHPPTQPRRGLAYCHAKSETLPQITAGGAWVRQSTPPHSRWADRRAHQPTDTTRTPKLCDPRQARTGDTLSFATSDVMCRKLPHTCQVSKRRGQSAWFGEGPKRMVRRRPRTGGRQPRVGAPRRRTHHSHALGARWAKAHACKTRKERSTVKSRTIIRPNAF